MNETTYKITAEPAGDLNFFGIKQEPFYLLPSDDFLYDSQSQAAALSQLMSYALEMRSGLSLLVGDSGIGKSLLVQSLSKMLPWNIRFIRIRAGLTDTHGVLQHIANALKIPALNKDNKELLVEIYRQLGRFSRENQRFIFFVDDAHQLDNDILESLVRISNKDVASAGIMKFLLVGQKPLETRLSSILKNKVAVRVGVKVHLKGLERHEIEPYVQQRLSAAGCISAGKRFSAFSYDEIYFFSDGNPLHINQICRQAMTIAREERAYVIDERIIEAAARINVTHPKMAKNERKASKKVKSGTVSADKDSQARQTSKLEEIFGPLEKGVQSGQTAKIEAVSEPVEDDRDLNGTVDPVDTTQVTATAVSEAVPALPPYQPALPSLSPVFLEDVNRILENIAIAAVEKDIKVIGIASAVAGEGCSTMAAALSHLICQRNRGGRESQSSPLLLIDTNTKDPAQHRMFCAEATPGLQEVLSEKVGTADAIQRFQDSSLALLPAGEQPNDIFAGPPAALLKDRLDQLRDDYQKIVIDLPPVMQQGDALALSKLCDAVVLVIKAGETRHQVVQKTILQLESAGVEILGGILNQREYHIPVMLYNKL